jgi:hypothetical protein
MSQSEVWIEFYGSAGYIDTRQLRIDTDNGNTQSTRLVLARVLGETVADLLVNVRFMPVQGSAVLWIPKTEVVDARSIWRRPLH